MNRFAFDPKKQIIDEWQQIYFCESIIDSFQTMIDKTHMYLEIINNYKTKEKKGKSRKLRSKNSLCSQAHQINGVDMKTEIKYFQSDDPQTSIRRINEWIENISQLQNKAKVEWQSSARDKVKEENKINITQETFNSENKLPISNKLDICSTHLEKITVQSFKFYHAILHQDFRIIEEFLIMKTSEVQAKCQKLEVFFIRIRQQNKYFQKVCIIFQNLFIETEYLKKFVHKNMNIFELHSHEKQFSSGYEEINEIRDKFMKRLDDFKLEIEQIKLKLRILYSTYIKKNSKRTRNHQKLQKKICSEIAVNLEQYQRNNSTISFVNGFTFAFLLCALISIIIFRQVKLNELQSDPNYLTSFKVWRGASYLIYFNWILGIIFWLLKKFRINYRLILIEEDTFIPNHQNFFLTASVLSAIYLTLFLIYLLFKLNIIAGNKAIQHMGFYMWGINLVFLFNPFKVLNYQGRRYFILIIYKFLLSLFRPMNMNIFFVAIIIGSFVQPFSDFAFTVCQVTSWGQKDCMDQTRIATFVFTMTYLFYRFVQSIRSHMQFGDRCYSRPLIGITAVIFSMNTVISSFLFNIYLTRQLQVYWIISATLSTVAGIQADLRADWGLISFDKQDCLLRKYKYFPKATYFIVSAIDIVLNIGWVLTISNNTAQGFGMHPVYFLMILSYVQLARKGMWIFFRIQDDHSLSIANLKALLDDSDIYKTLDQLMSIRGPLSLQIAFFHQKEIAENKQNGQTGKNGEVNEQGKSSLQQKESENIYSINTRQHFKNQTIKSSKSDGQQGAVLKQPKSLSEIQKMVINKKLIRASLRQLIRELKVYLNIIHSIYKNLDWEDQQ